MRRIAWLLIERLDGWLLYVVFRVSIWITEWFSISKRVQLNALIVAYVTLQMTYWRYGLEFPFWLGLMVFGPFAVGMWLLEPATDLHRVRLIYSLNFIVVRTIILAVFVVLIVTIAWLDYQSHRHDGTFNTGGNFCYMLHMYLKLLPENHRRGRRRKLAAAKLKKMFGSLDWLPQPERV